MSGKVKVTLKQEGAPNWRIHVIGGPFWRAGDEPVFVGAHPTREDAEAHIKHMGWEIAE